MDAGIEAGPCTSWWEAQREQAENNAPSQRCSRSRAGHLRYFSRHRLIVLSVHDKKRWRRARRRKVKYLRGGGCVFMFNWGTRMMVEQIHFSPLSIAVLHFSSLVHVQLCMCCQIPGNTPKVGQGRCRGVERIQLC